MGELMRKSILGILTGICIGWIIFYIFDLAHGDVLYVKSKYQTLAPNGFDTALYPSFFQSDTTLFDRIHSWHTLRKEFMVETSIICISADSSVLNDILKDTKISRIKAVDADSESKNIFRKPK